MAYSNLFFQAFVYLLAAVITVPFAKRLGLGSVLGYLLAGILIGPFVLGMVSRHTDNVMHFAEFGVVMMLFLVGLELRPTILWQLRRSLVLVGGLQLVLTTIVIGGLALLFGQKLAASLAIGMILASSSTAIVLQMLNEKGWARTEAGKTVFSILLFQDIAVIPILAFFPLLATKTSTVTHFLPGLKQSLLVVGVIIAIIIGGRFLLRPLFRFIAKARLREAFTATALALVVGIALAMQAVGLSPALGTFLAGVVLAESEYRHELESDIEPFKGLLLGLFFISVGASINFPVIGAHLTLIIGLVLLLIVVKLAVLAGIGKLFRQTWHDNLLIGMSLAQGGEFCFVLLSYALKQHVLTQPIANTLVVVVALSMLATPIVMMVYEKGLEKYFIARQILSSDIVDQMYPVVIAGFGRFGQVIGRFLLANQIKPTILDLDAGQIETLRKVGYKVFYGDAERLDLLHTAGLAHAQLFIIAIDDSDKALKIAQAVRRDYPHIKILLRVRGRTQAYDALEHGFPLTSIHRETFDSALAMAREALHQLGVTSAETLRAAELFKQLDEASLQELAPLYHSKDKKFFFNRVRKNRENLEKVITSDQEALKKTP